MADDVRPRRCVGGALERRRVDPERGEVDVAPEPVLPARMVRRPARAEGLLLLRQRPGAEPDPVQDPRDPASPESPRERSGQRSLGLAARDDLELRARADAQPAHVLVHKVELELVSARARRARSPSPARAPTRRARATPATAIRGPSWPSSRHDRRMRGSASRPPGQRLAPRVRHLDQQAPLLAGVHAQVGLEQPHAHSGTDLTSAASSSGSGCGARRANSSGR